MSTLINITSKPQETTKAEELQIVASWKDTDKRPISAANKKRAVILPANIWSATTANMENSFRVFVLDAIEELAKSYLSAIVEESNWMRTQVPLADFQLENLLAWQNQRAESSGRLSAEAIKAWAEQSATVTNAKTVHGDKVAAALVDTFAKLAGPNHGLAPDRATKILTKLWQAADSNDPTGVRVQLRMQGIIDKASKLQEDVLGDVL